MKRYLKFSEIINVSQGKRRYSSLYYPNIPERDNDIYIISKRGDRVDLLSYQYYRDPRYWWIIQRENNLPAGTFVIPPGLRIRIPSISETEIERLMIETQL